jgi:hypothetical protein
MKTSSAKAKGRRLQSFVVDAVRAALRLHEPDIRPAIMGETGMDIKLSMEARRHWPYATECKNVQKIAIWESLEQAEGHASAGLEPLLVFSRNRARVWAVVPFEHLVELRRELADLRAIDDCETAARGEAW